MVDSRRAMNWCDAFARWLFVDPCCLDVADVRDRLDVGDLLVAIDDGDVAIVASGRGGGGGASQVMTGNASTPIAIDEFVGDRQRVAVRLLSIADNDALEHQRRQQLAADVRHVLVERRRRRRLATTTPVLERAIRAAGGTWASMPRRAVYSESDSAAMRAASSAYAAVDTYIRLGLVEPLKSTNLYDWHDLLDVAGDFDLAFVDERIALTRPIYVRWRR